jgi:hypothetical protein
MHACMHVCMYACIYVNRDNFDVFVLGEALTRQLSYLFADLYGDQTLEVSCLGLV